MAAAVARNVRAARAARGWSLETLAARAGVSKGILISLEQGRSNPNLATLIRISDALGQPLTRLVDVESQPPVRVVSAGAGTVLWRGPAGGQGVLLTGSDQPTAVELWDWTLAPGEEQRGDAHAAGTRELLVVLGGQLDLSVDGTEVQVPAGAAVSLAGDRPHRYANRGATPVRYIAAIAVPRLPPHPRTPPAGGDTPTQREAYHKTLPDE